MLQPKKVKFRRQQKGKMKVLPSVGMSWPLAPLELKPYRVNGLQAAKLRLPGLL